MTHTVVIGQLNSLARKPFLIIILGGSTEILDSVNLVAWLSIDKSFLPQLTTFSNQIW